MWNACNTSPRLIHGKIHTHNLTFSSSNQQTEMGVHIRASRSDGGGDADEGQVLPLPQHRVRRNSPENKKIPHSDPPHHAQTRQGGTVRRQGFF